MDLPVTISRRNVKRVRLQINSAGLFVIVPNDYDGDIKELIIKHKAWIKKHVSKFAKMQQEVENLELSDRTMEQLHDLVLKQLMIIQDILKVSPEKITYRTMKTRWGSCSESGRLSLNTKLRHLPEELIEYVVAHEAVHMIHHNHSKAFWQTLGEFSPDFKNHKNILKLYAIVLNENEQKAVGNPPWLPQGRMISNE